MIQSEATSITVAEEGYYFLELVNSRNETTKKINSTGIEVLYSPSIPVVTPNSPTQVSIDDTPVLEVNVTAAPYSTVIRYVWKKKKRYRIRRYHRFR